MKEGIHPDYHEITYVMTDGTKATVRTTWGKKGDVMNLDIDPKSHPAWTGVHRLLDTGGQLSKFKNKFGNLSMDASAKSKEAKPESEEPKEAKKAKK